jgi:hypothetical protein
MKPFIHGIVSNLISQGSTKPNVFQLAIGANRTTAAAAFYWFSELYNHCPYDKIDDREVDNNALPIQHGRFYTQDEYPDIDLFATAGMLVRRFSPDYLLVHPMGMDNTGGDHGMNADGQHGGTTPDVREVPLYFIRPGQAGLGDTRTTVSQLQIAPTLCKLLEIDIPSSMKAAAII